MSFWRSNVFKMRICVINIFAAYKLRSMVLPNENGPLDCAFILWCHIEDVVICQVLFNAYCWQKGVISSHGNSASSLLQWRHNEHDGVSNHQHHDCFLNHLFRRRTHKTIKLRITGLCARNSLVTKEFPAQRASNAENVSILWRHHAIACPFIWFIHHLHSTTGPAVLCPGRPPAYRSRDKMAASFFAGDIFQLIFFYQNCCILTQIWMERHLCLPIQT